MYVRLLGPALVCILVASGFSRTDVAAVASGFSRTDSVRAVSWREAAPIVDRLIDILPASLREIPPGDRERRWDDWLRTERAAIAERMVRGDEDSLVNLLLFGTSFTAEPRITPALLADLDRRWKAGDRSAQETLLGAYRRRAIDLVTAIGRRPSDERMRFARSVLERRGYRLETEAGRQKASDYLLEAVVRVRQEAAALARALEAARGLPDRTAAFAERSRVFRDRGLAPDSSVLTQFAVDRALADLRVNGTLGAGRVARVAIVGPGLDFADKQEGFDFYQPQTLQPFTVIDSLIRCGAADPRLRVTTIDVSPRVNAHLLGAVQWARRTGRSYKLVLPRDTRAQWNQDAIAYWNEMGGRVGRPFPVAAPSSLPGVRARGVAVRPDALARLRVIEANIVFDRLGTGGDNLFDLVVATNVLVYYDTFEQALAMASIASVLRSGGLLLTNDAMPEIPETPLKSSGYVTVPFSDREGDGERMVVYRKW